MAKKEKAEKPPKAEKPKKAPKAPKEKKPPRVKTPKEPKLKSAAKKGGGGLFTLIIILFILVLFSGAVVAYMYNFYDVKTMVVQFFATQDESYQQKWAELQEEDRIIGENWALLDEKEAELTSLEQALLDRSAKLDSREENIIDRESAFASEQESFTQGRMELEKIVEAVAAMSPQSAADMLQSFNDVDRVALILSNMEPKQNAKILKAMPTEVAASITELLMSKSGR